MGQIVDLTI